MPFFYTKFVLSERQPFVNLVMMYSTKWHTSQSPLPCEKTGETAFTDPWAGARYRHSRNCSNRSYLKSFEIGLVFCQFECMPRNVGCFPLRVSCYSFPALWKCDEMLDRLAFMLFRCVIVCVST